MVRTTTSAHRDDVLDRFTLAEGMEAAQDVADRLGWGGASMVQGIGRVTRGGGGDVTTGEGVKMTADEGNILLDGHGKTSLP